MKLKCKMHFNNQSFYVIKILLNHGKNLKAILINVTSIVFCISLTPNLI